MDNSLSGEGVFPRQSNWNFDYICAIKGHIDEIDKKKVKFDIKWYKTGSHLEPSGSSDVEVNMSKDGNTFEGIWKNLEDGKKGKYQGKRSKKD